MKKRILAMILCMLMIVSMLPTWAMAEETHDHDHEHAEEAATEETIVEVPEEEEPEPAEEEDDTITEIPSDADEEAEEPEELQEENEGEEEETEVEIQGDAQPVTVVFKLDPEDTVLIVYTLSETEEKQIIEPQEDGSYLLLPGEYYYDAKCEGYESLKEILLVVTDATSIQVTLQPVEDDTISIASTNVSGDEFVAYARQFIGKPYISGGRTTAGFDCCGLVWYVCNHFGIDIGTGNQSSQINYGTTISYNKSSYSSVIQNMKIGDLLYFDYGSNGSIDHVAIYTGNGNIINAENSGVLEHTLNQGGWPDGYMWTSICGIRRVLSDNTHYLDVNAKIDGVQQGNLGNCGVFDVYINGSLDEANAKDYYKPLASGTRYEIKNIRGFGYQYNGSASITGTIGSEEVQIVLDFTQIPQNSSAAKTVTFNGHTYERYDYHLSWSEAKAFCENKGGHLVSITNAQEQAAVVNLLSDCPFGFYYLGGTDPNQSMNWKWVTGESFTYENWDKDYPEPSQGEEEYYCTIIGQDNPPNKSIGEWVDSPNDGTEGFYGKQNSGFICEYDYDNSVQYTITYNANGGTGAPTSQTKRSGQAITLSSTVPSKSCHVFVGWATSSTATTAQYQPGATYSADADLTLYAVWREGSSTEWSTTRPTGYSDSQIEEKTQYRYRDKETTTGTSSTMSGWTLEGSQQVWSDWSTTPPTGIDETQVETRTLYGWYYYECPSCHAHMTTQGTCNKAYGGCGATITDDGWHCMYDPTNWSVAQAWYSATNRSYAMINGERWFNWPDHTQTQYRYQSTVYTFYRWLNWSDWGDTVYTESDTRQVGTRTVYRAIIEGDNVHSWNSGTVTKAATCTTSGTMTYTCTLCGKTKTETIAALGHNLTAHPAVAATCTTAGNSAYWSCSRCNKYFSDAAGTTEIAKNSWVIAKLGHNLTAHPAVAATCTTAGNSAYWSCSRCNKYFSDAAGTTEIAKNSWVIAKLNHDLTAHPAVAATCTTAGNSAYWSCSRCNKYFSDAAGTTEIAKNSWVIAAPGHNLTAHPAVAATCTTAGNSAYWSCSRCNKYFSDAAGTTEIAKNSWVIAAPGHNLTAHPAVAATCTTAGNSAYWSCSRCNKYFSDAAGATEIAANSWVIAATGHSWGAWTVTKAATCTEKGTETRVCSHDSSHKETRDIAALGHNYEDGFCTRCGAADPDYVVDTTGIITVSSLRGRPGDEVTVDISLTENPGIMALTLGISYDNTRLSYLGFEDGGLTDWSVASKAVWLGNSNSSYNGVILKLKFKILDDAAEGDAAVTVTCGRGDMVDASENVYVPEIKSGKVTVIYVIPGDMNGDGSVNAIDLVRLKRYIAGEDVNLVGAGDCTGDGQVNAIDLVRLKRFIAGENVELH